MEDGRCPSILVTESPAGVCRKYENMCDSWDIERTEEPKDPTVRMKPTVRRGEDPSHPIYTNLSPSRTPLSLDL